MAGCVSICSTFAEYHKLLAKIGPNSGGKDFKGLPMPHSPWIQALNNFWAYLPWSFGDPAIFCHKAPLLLHLAIPDLSAE